MTLKPRIAHVTTIALSQRFLLLNQLQAIRAAGYGVAGVSAPGDDARALTDVGIAHHPVPMTRRWTPFADLRSVDDLARLFRRERFNVVHTHNPKPALLGVLAARLAGVPVVMHTIHGFYWHENMKPWLRRALIDLDRIASSMTDLVFSQSQEDVDTAVAEGVCPREKLVPIGNGIDVSRFRKNPFSRTRVRNALGIDSDAPVVGFVGRLVVEKGLVELLAAFANVRRKIPNALLVLVGEPDLHKADAFDPKKHVRGDASDGVMLLGHRSDVDDLYNAFDILALPSHREGFPRTPMEASACGVPVVATRIRGCREAVDDGDNGLLVPVRDERALADAMHALLDDPERRARMSRHAERIARTRFDERRVFRTIIDAYARVLRAKGFDVPDPRSSSSSSSSSSQAEAA